MLGQMYYLRILALNGTPIPKTRWFRAEEVAITPTTGLSLIVITLIDFIILLRIREAFGSKRGEVELE